MKDIATPDGYAGLDFPWDEPPAEGEVIEVAEGVLWARLPLPMALDHVNVYFLREADGWTMVDTGFDTRRTRTILDRLRAGPLGGDPITRVFVTHHHPDHIGLAGWLQAEGAELLTTRTAWLMARMLILDEQPVPPPETQEFCRRWGMDPGVLAQRSKERPFNFADMVAPLPVGFTRIAEGDLVDLGGRRWRVARGDGHAAEHAVLFEESGDLVLGGDQLLPGISPNLGLYPTERNADPVGDWMAACTRLAPLARDDQLVLPGHKTPYRGLPTRLASLHQNHVTALNRLEAHLAEPRTGGACFAPLFKRQVTQEMYGLAFFEAIAHLQHLHLTGRALRETRDDGVWIFRAA
ncbi:MBL fold metallo-hydrolase [Jannaschia seohaensis]|uniref:Glyoxylase, beta-lactamase superfamily II n=1 Tax=Jannaschia seohaensis TaxID=475081 RepID=A0A2Y9B5P8_9RHOB|nr:MBL fold metallo-hydrolase [Jannaschia seohaensis]PWJ10330.1 glyoxylase-like metal-dependent hydrolase (beta-lactamase superfamily II) [Jannaschia seohaensis]SSA51730.1 Glyoxylase, beta-lactamase superfamily II [Jannaschia seohaensis]